MIRRYRQKPGRPHGNSWRSFVMRISLGQAALALLFLASAASAQAPSPKPEKEARYRGKPAAYWLQRLTNEDQKDRRTAFYALKALGEETARSAIPVLIDMLEDHDPEFRIFAANYLGQLGPAAKAAAPGLIAMLKEKKREARSAALDGLRGIGPEAAAAIPCLVQLLASDDHGPEAATVLRAIGPAAREALPVLKNEFARRSAAVQGDSEYYLRDFILSMAALGPEAFPLLMDLFESSKQDWLDVAIAGIFAEQGAKAKAILPRLAKALPGRSAACRADGGWALWQINRHPSAVPMLMQALEELAGAPQTGWELSTLCWRLGAIGPPAKQAVPTLTKILARQDSELCGYTRRNAAWALWTIAGHQESIAILAKCVVWRSDTYVRAMVDYEAVKMLGDIGPQAKVCLPALQEALSLARLYQSINEVGGSDPEDPIEPITDAIRKVSGKNPK
jgi:HEAT repeat protein